MSDAGGQGNLSERCPRHLSAARELDVEPADVLAGCTASVSADGGRQMHGVDAHDAGQLRACRRVLEPRSQVFLDPQQPERRPTGSFAARLPRGVGNQLERQALDDQGRDAVRIVSPRNLPRGVAGEVLHHDAVLS
jgi:hypothetical protein